MTLSSRGVHLIASFEGFLPNWYRDVGGVETIGYGHTGELPSTMHSPITIDQGLTLLGADARIAEAAVNAAIKVSLGQLTSHAQTRYDALVSLAFNIGGGAFSSSSLVRVINEKGAPRDWSVCGPYWLEWDHVNGVVVQGLLNRRREEFGIFERGVY